VSPEAQMLLTARVTEESRRAGPSQRLYEDDGFRDTKVSESHMNLGVTSVTIELPARRRGPQRSLLAPTPVTTAWREPLPTWGYSNCSLHMRRITLTSSWPVAPTILLE
jgi:hypothetical protein